MLSQSGSLCCFLKLSRKIDSAETQDIATEITKHLPDPTARGNKAQNIPLPLLNSAAGQS